MENEEKKNLAHEYGLLSNVLYILKKIVTYKKALLLIIIVGSISASSMNFIWTFLGKYIVDLIQKCVQTNTNGIKQLFKLIGIASVVEIVMISINTQMQNTIWFNCIYVRMKIIKERIAKSLTLNYEKLENPDTLDIKQRAENATGDNTHGVEGLIHSIYEQALNFVNVIAAIGIIFTFNPFFVIIIFVFAFFQFLFMNYIRKKDKKVTWDALAPFWRKISYMEQTTQDFSFGKDIRLYNMKAWLLRKQKEVYDVKHKKIVISRNYWIANSAFSFVVNLLRLGIVYSYLIYSVINKGLSIGDFILYTGSIEVFSNSMSEFLGKFSFMKQQSMQVDDFRTFMDIKNIDDEKSFKKMPSTDKMEFTFENVSFKYPNQENYSLKNINLTIKNGEKLAVVGLNGAGKTTFIKLLVRLYDVTEGRILLNGTDVREFDRNEYFSLISPVFQDVQIFAFPIGENISMKTPEETDFNLAAEKMKEANLAEKLKSLPNGINTELLKVLDEHGIDLSGGEKQKLALARALYKNAPVIVLDEPTAALDAIAEYKLYQDFNRLIGEKTAIYISHRLSSTRFCDNVALFWKGELVEYGTHESLLEKGGKYAEMFDVQSQYYKENAQSGVINE